jgi:hypothetical protein
MTELTHIIDTEGEVIIFLKCPESLFALWNDNMVELELLKSYSNMQKRDNGNNATQEGFNKKVIKKRLKKKNKRGNLMPL